MTIFFSNVLFNPKVKFQFAQNETKHWSCKHLPQISNVSITWLSHHI